ncbi:MAG TPA: hypothetical protein VFB62_01605, partial [Polyangiaceae bacterium]|nr:hypothetical protein [Polyangiaceae bacterium]
EPLCGGELPPGTHVPALESNGAAIRRWSQQVLALLPERGDGFAILWSLAQSVDAQEGVSLDRQPQWSELTPLFAALAQRTTTRAQSAAGWRAPDDRVRQLAEWLDRAARALAGGARFDEPHSERDEAFYVRAIIHGHQAALMDQPLATALRDLAVRVLLARSAAVHASDDDPMARHPLSAVETMMRAQGLGGWLAQET